MLVLFWKGKESDRHNDNRPAHPNNERSRHNNEKDRIRRPRYQRLGRSLPWAGCPRSNRHSRRWATRLGFSGLTKIGIDHLNWLDDIRPKAKVPMVDTRVQQSR